MNVSRPWNVSVALSADQGSHPGMTSSNASAWGRASRAGIGSGGCKLKDSRDMFDQACAIIMEGVETGVVEADTEYYQIPHTEIRPRPFKSFGDRLVQVTMSPSSVEVAPRLEGEALDPA